MEWYESHCPDCKTTYRWTGYKTGIGKSQAQLDQMKRNQTVCRECGSENLKTGLDHTSPAARDMDAALSGAIKAMFEPVA